MIDILTTIKGAIIGAALAIGSFFGVANIEQPMVGDALPQSVALFETSLASPISSSATSMTLTANSIRGGGALSGYNCFTVDEGSTSAEFICGTVASTAVTSLERGISPSTGTTTVAALQFAHRRGAQVKITDFPIIQILKAQNNGEGTYDNILNYQYSPTFLTASSTAIVSKGYVDGLAFGGTIAGVTAGGTGQSTLPQDMLLVGNGVSGITGTSSPTVAYVTATSTTGTSAFAGNVTVSKIFTANSTSTMNATTTIAASSVAGAPLRLNGVDYAFPSSHGSDNQFLTENGSGTLTWESPTVRRYYDVGSAGSATSGNYATTTTAITLPAGSITASSTIKFTAYGTCTDGGTNGDCEIYLRTSTGATIMSNGFGVGDQGGTIYADLDSRIFSVSASSHEYVNIAAGNSAGVNSYYVSQSGSSTSTADLSGAVTFAVVIRGTNNATISVSGYSLEVNP